MRPLSILLIAAAALINTSFTGKSSLYSLTVDVSELRNSTGVVQFALYNKDGTIPDEDYKKYYLIQKVKIKDRQAVVKFINLPKGSYAVNVLHDENENGKIEKGFFLPTEGVGFSNFKSIGLTNRPSFSKASFELKSDLKVSVRVIYF